MVKSWFCNTSSSISFNSETKKARRLLDLQYETLNASHNDSVLSTNDQTNCMAELSQRVTVTALTGIANYIMLSQPSDDMLFEINRLFKSANALCVSGERSMLVHVITPLVGRLVLLDHC